MVVRIYSYGWWDISVLLLRYIATVVVLSFVVWYRVIVLGV